MVPDEKLGDRRVDRGARKVAGWLGAGTPVGSRTGKQRCANQRCGPDGTAVTVVF